MKDNTERMLEDMSRVEEFERDLQTLTQEEMIEKYLQPRPFEPAKPSHQNWLTAEDSDGIDMDAILTAHREDA